MARTLGAKGRERPAPDQARPHPIARLLLLGLPLAATLVACAVPDQLDPRALGRDISGAALGSRLPPPGMDLPLPNLASVPPIPDRPDLAARERLTRRLEGERAAASSEVPVQRQADPLSAPDAPGQPPIPARPPGPPALAAAPVIPWGVPRRPQPVPAVADPTARPPELLSPEGPTPGEVPALPTPDLLAPAPAPRAPSVEQLAPSDVPPLPSPDLLAPAAPR